MANWDIFEDLIYGCGFLGTEKGVAFVNGKSYILKALYELFAKFPALDFFVKGGNMYFVILYTFNASCGYTEAEQQKLFADHVRYIKGLHANKKIVMSGAYNDINGGLVILEVESRKKAEIIMAEDPALKSSL
jgi:uncharacterized protein YciI